MSGETFNYVVARPWYPNNPDSALAIYAYGSQVQSGTMGDALEFLDYVKFSSCKDGPKEWSIYKVEFQKIPSTT